MLSRRYEMRRRVREHIVQPGAHGRASPEPVFEYDMGSLPSERVLLLRVW